MAKKNEEKRFYSKQELEEFREIITKKIEEAKGEHGRLTTSMKEISGNSTDSFNITEYGNESAEKEQIEILLARQAKFVVNLENALVRINNGSYGICRITQKLIPKERLRIVPHATTSMEGKQMEQKNRPKR